MNTNHVRSKSTGKSKMKWAKEKSFGSLSSLNSGRRKKENQIPEELSLEEVKALNGQTVTYLRVYCEKIRPGDHFKTIKVRGATTAEQCVRELAEIYSSRISNPKEVGLYEVIGRIAPLNPSESNQEALLGFSEIRCRLIEPQETVQSIFFGSRAGIGLSRRIELRKLDYPHASFPAAASSGSRSSTPASTPRSNSAVREYPRDDSRRSSAESTASRGMPPLRRAMTPAGSNLTLRDSRRKSKYRTPHGPHLTLIRGLQPKYDIPLWDLTPIIQKGRTQSEMTIGTREDASIRTYVSLDEQQYKLSASIIFAKLVGYDYPLSNNTPAEHTGAIFIEPYFNGRIGDHTVEFPSIPSIYINEELINPGPEVIFEKRLLRPGDFICFGSRKHGYMFLFKDPRWIPDHLLELGIPLNGNGNTLGDSSVSFNSMNGLTSRNGDSTAHGRAGFPSNRSSDTDSPFSRSQSKATVDHLPRMANLRQVLTALIPQVHSNRSNSYAPVDPFDSPRWSRIEPWRSAGLLAHLVRTAAGYIIQSCPSIPNRDVEERDSKLIQDYAINYLKDIRSLMIEFYQTTRKKNPDLLVLELWFSLFCYNVAVYLSPGWLTNSNGLSRHTSRADRIRGYASDGPDSAISSPGSNRENPPVIESLLVISDIRESAYQLAMESINTVVRIAFEELPPYLKDFLNGPNSSPTGGNRFFANNVVNYPELRHRLNKLSSCFQAAFYLPGSSDGDLTSSTASSPFHSGSVEVSNMTLDNLPEQSIWQMSVSRDRTYPGASPMENSDQSFSPGSESDNGEHSTLFNGTQSRQSHYTSLWTISSGRGPIDTASRIEAVVWRHILAGVSHHLLCTLVSNDSIPIDWETGDKLLRGVNWLYDWLRSQHLENHRRPLNMVADFANLLATPRDQLFKMSWSGMRSIYPQIPPSLLKFLLDEYEVDGEIKDMPTWRVDQRDANEADEDTSEVLDRVMNTWRSKESLLYVKNPYQTAPIYRPQDLWDLFNIPATVDVARRLDQQLEAQRIDFRWLSLIRRNPGVRAIPLLPEADQDAMSRPQTRRQSNSRHSRTTNGQRLPSTPHGMTRSNPNLLYGSEDFTTNSLQMISRRVEHEVSVPRMNERTDLTNQLKPAPSKGEPIRIIRSYSNTNHTDNNQNKANNYSEQSQRALLTPNQPPANPHEAALYHLQGLAASLPHVNFSEILAKYQQSSAVGTRTRPSLSEQQQTPSTPTYPVSESQPYLNYMRPARSQMNGLQSYQPENSPTVTEYPRMTPLDKNLRPANRLAQSLWHLPTDRTASPARDPLRTGYGQQVVAASQNWDDFRMATLRRGLERVRGPSTSSALNTPRHPMHSQVSASLGNLNTVLHQNPHIIVEEMTGASSGSLADSFLDRESNVIGGRSDDLGDVLTRSVQGATVSNITLTRSPTTGFGLILVDGERTMLDQPGVFVKGVVLNSPASANGEFGQGDRILAINGTDLTGLTYKESLTMLKNCGMHATFTVRHCDLNDPTVLLERKKT
ncbi:hypothetical protein D915_003152 [Fasciola hepatica]|uniref:PDZ domain-containing protein n=1 Tax=Fasciola hepatica TaxID=6192 RepID=A0A4E0RGK2_FASHE|nr:hypothetical protein D915_003152 [Fasciola hepatica]